MKKMKLADFSNQLNGLELQINNLISTHDHLFLIVPLTRGGERRKKQYCDSAIATLRKTKIEFERIRCCQYVLNSELKSRPELLENVKVSSSSVLPLTEESK